MGDSEMQRIKHRQKTSLQVINLTHDQRKVVLQLLADMDVEHELKSYFYYDPNRLPKRRYRHVIWATNLTDEQSFDLTSALRQHGFEYLLIMGSLHSPAIDE